MDLNRKVTWWPVKMKIVESSIFISNVLDLRMPLQQMISSFVPLVQRKCAIKLTLHELLFKLFYKLLLSLLLRPAPWWGHYSSTGSETKQEAAVTSYKSRAISISSDATGCLRWWEGPSQSHIFIPTVKCSSIFLVFSVPSFLDLCLCFWSRLCLSPFLDCCLTDCTFVYQTLFSLNKDFWSYNWTVSRVVHLSPPSLCTSFDNCLTML